MTSRQLLFPNDAVTKDLFLKLPRANTPITQDGVSRTVLASAKAASNASYRVLRAGQGGGPAAVSLGHFDLCVMATLAAMLKEGSPGFTIAGVMARLGYANPHARGMLPTADAVSASLFRLITTNIEMGEVAGYGDKAWLDSVSMSPVVSARLLGEYRGASTCGEFVPPDPADPLSAAPLLLRAVQAGQVVGVSPEQMPDFSGRRVSLPQRQIALYLTVRALERKTSCKVLVESMLGDVGVSFPAGGAGRQARSRAISQVVSTLDAMSEQGAVIVGYELERECGRVRAIVLDPVHRN